MTAQINENLRAYLAGYFERGGYFAIFLEEDTESPKLADGVTSIIGAGLYIRVRDQDPVVPKLLHENFAGRLKQGQMSTWQAWNLAAAQLLEAIQPFLKTGKRKAEIKLLLDFYEYLKSTYHFPIEVSSTWKHRQLFSASEQREIRLFYLAEQELKKKFRGKREAR